MSDEKFKKIADQFGGSDEEKKLVEKALKAAKEGRDNDLIEISKNLCDKKKGK